jgi:GPH family glycoside/pentoside/hexuronide:cation symporter
MSETVTPPVPPPSATAPEDRVPLVQKFAYSLGSCHDVWGHWLYPNLVNTVFIIHLGASPVLVGFAMMLNRLFDAVSDPVFGRLSDNTRTRFGRRRPYILFGGALAGIGMPLLFMVGHGWSDHAYFWFMVASSAIFIPVMSSFNMAYQSLGAEMTPDYHERTSLYSFRFAFQKLPEFMIYVAPWFTTLVVWVGATHQDLPRRLWLLLSNGEAWTKAAPDQHPNVLLGAQVCFGFLGLVMIVTAAVSFFLLRERYYGKVVERNQAKISLKDTLVATLRCRPFRSLLLMVVAFAAGQSMVGSLSYYTTIYHVCGGDLARGNGWWAIMGITSSVMAVLGLVVFGFIAHRIGKRRAIMSALVFSIVMYVATWWLYTPKFPWLMPIIWGLVNGAGATGIWMLFSSMQADVMDYDELSTEMRREGAFSACSSWMIKAGMALGAGGAIMVLPLTGFSAKLSGGQTEHTILLIRVLFMAVPVIGLLLAIGFIARYPLTQARVNEIRRELETRRGKV